ncbi:MAG: NrsF family protein [Candidatus Binatia bacterium]
MERHGEASPQQAGTSAPLGAFLEELAGRLPPVKAVRPARLTIVLLLLQAVVVLIAVALSRPRPDLGLRLVEPLFVSLAATLAVAGAVSGAFAVLAGIPGRVPGRAVIVLLWSLPVVLAAASAVLSPRASAGVGMVDLLSRCWSCVGITTGVAAVVGAIALLLIRPLASLWEVRAGILAGLSGGFLGALVTELHCEITTADHVALSHFLPIAAVACAGPLISAIFHAWSGRVPSRGVP